MSGADGLARLERAMHLFTAGPDESPQVRRAFAMWRESATWEAHAPETVAWWRAEVDARARKVAQMLDGWVGRSDWSVLTDRQRERFVRDQEDVAAFAGMILRVLDHEAWARSFSAWTEPQGLVSALGHLAQALRDHHGSADEEGADAAAGRIRAGLRGLLPFADELGKVDSALMARANSLGVIALAAADPAPGALSVMEEMRGPVLDRLVALARARAIGGHKPRRKRDRIEKQRRMILAWNAKPALIGDTPALVAVTGIPRSTVQDLLQSTEVADGFDRLRKLHQQQASARKDAEAAGAREDSAARGSGVAGTKRRGRAGRPISRDGADKEALGKFRR